MIMNLVLTVLYKLGLIGLLEIINLNLAVMYIMCMKVQKNVKFQTTKSNILSLSSYTLA